jgi:hypothetical protein
MQRRDLLKLISALTLSQQPWTTAASAQIPARTAGRKIGINLSPVTYWSTEHPFRNLALSASRWRLQENEGAFSWDLPLPPLNDEGYPLVIPGTAFLESFLVFTSHREHLPAQLVVSYEGTGRLEYLAGCNLVRREANRDIIRNLGVDGPMIARLHATSDKDPLRNITISETPNDSGDTFRKPFLNRLSGMSALRFMDWMDTNNSKLRGWNDRPKPNRYSQSEGGVAAELMVELCNELKVAPWFTMPHLADENFVRRFAELVRDTLDPALPVYVEYSNEVWNALFEQAQYAIGEGTRLGLSANPYEAGLRYYSQRASEVLTIWEDVFDEDQDRVQGVYASHAVNAWSSDVILSWGEASEHADVLAIAPYFGGGLGSRDQAAETARWTLDQLFAALEHEVDTTNREWLESQSAMAKRFGVRLTAYEGGQHLVGYSGTPHDDVLHGLFARANRDPRMGDLYRKHFQHWEGVGGDTYVLFNSMGEYGQFGCWGLLEYEAQDHSAKWQAVQALLQT